MRHSYLFTQPVSVECGRLFYFALFKFFAVLFATLRDSSTSLGMTSLGRRRGNGVLEPVAAEPAERQLRAMSEKHNTEGDSQDERGPTTVRFQ